MIDDKNYEVGLRIFGIKSNSVRSFLLQYIARSISTDNEKPVLYFCLDKSRQDFVDGFTYMTDHSDVQNDDVFSVEKLNKDWHKLLPLNIYINNTDISIQSIKEQIEQMFIINRSLSLVIIDYLQLINEPSSCDIFTTLKDIAVSLNIPIILSSHISKKYNGGGKLYIDLFREADAIRKHDIPVEVIEDNTANYLKEYIENRNLTKCN